MPHYDCPLIIPKTFSRYYPAKNYTLKLLAHVFSSHPQFETPSKFTPLYFTITTAWSPSSFLKYFPDIFSIKICIKSCGFCFRKPTLLDIPYQFMSLYHTMTGPLAPIRQTHTQSDPQERRERQKHTEGKNNTPKQSQTHSHRHTENHRHRDRQKHI